MASKFKKGNAEVEIMTKEQIRKANAKKANAKYYAKLKAKKEEERRKELERKLTAEAVLGNSQEAKADNGKPQLSLVPLEILNAIARVREYGNRKYGSSDNWKIVEPRRYKDAMLRHMVEYINNTSTVDNESGLPHLWHLACNVAFLIALEGK